MKILLINTSDQGGAANACIRLHIGLLKIGVDSKLLLLSKTDSLPATADYYAYYEKNYLEKLNSRSFLAKAKEKVLFLLNVNEEARILSGAKIKSEIEATKPKEKAIEVFTFPYSGYKVHEHPLYKQADIVHLHWVNNFLDYQTFFRANTKPIVWTLHEMNPFTGGCSYAADCKKFLSDCSYCPQLEGSLYPNHSNEIYTIKANALTYVKDIRIVANSYWLESQARISSLFNKIPDIQTIHLGLDTNEFYPKDKLACKSALGVSADTFTISFGADSFTNIRKGFKQLIASLRLIHEKYKNVCCLVFGKGTAELESAGLPALKILGPVKSSEMLSVVYSASDIFVIPSLYEAFGLTSLEAMACGTPVVGFDTGGIPDMIKPLETGLLAEVGNSEDLAQKIEWMLLNKQEREKMGRNARKLVEQNFYLELQAEKYKSLYQTLLYNK